MVWPLHALIFQDMLGGKKYNWCSLNSRRNQVNEGDGDQTVKPRSRHMKGAGEQAVSKKQLSQREPEQSVKSVGLLATGRVSGIQWDAIREVSRAYSSSVIIFFKQIVYSWKDEKSCHWALMVRGRVVAKTLESKGQSSPRSSLMSDRLKTKRSNHPAHVGWHGSESISEVSWPTAKSQRELSCGELGWGMTFSPETSWDLSTRKTREGGTETFPVIHVSKEERQSFSWKSHLFCSRQVLLTFMYTILLQSSKTLKGSYYFYL